MFCCPRGNTWAYGNYFCKRLNDPTHQSPLGTNRVSLVPMIPMRPMPRWSRKGMASSSTSTTSLSRPEMGGADGQINLHLCTSARSTSRTTPSRRSGGPGASRISPTEKSQALGAQEQSRRVPRTVRGAAARRPEGRRDDERGARRCLPSFGARVRRWR